MLDITIVSSPSEDNEDALSAEGEDGALGVGPIAGGAAAASVALLALLFCVCRGARAWRTHFRFRMKQQAATHRASPQATIKRHRSRTGPEGLHGHTREAAPGQTPCLQELQALPSSSPPRNPRDVEVVLTGDK